MEKFEDFLKNNYPGGYIEHYLAMYSIHQKDLSDENFENQNIIYSTIEGTEEFQNLKNEMIKAKRQADLELFLEIALAKKIRGINLNDLTKMFEAVEKFQIKKSG